MWIFDVDRHAMWWGNVSALTFWNADGLAAFQAKDFSGDSQIVRDRLQQIVTSGAKGARFQESWTLYPAGQPTTILADIAPIYIAEGRRAILVEASYPLDFAQDPEALRLLEAAKNSPLMISTYSLSGALLAQNTAAAICYGATRLDFADDASVLKRRIAEPALSHALLQAAREDQEVQREFSVETQAGRRWHRVTARRGRDPITGQAVLILSEEDIDDLITSRSRLAEAKERLEERVVERTQALTAANRSLKEEIAERERAQGELTLRNAWLTTILDNTPVEIVLRDRDGVELAASKRRWLLHEAGVDSDADVETDDQRVLETGAPLQREIVGRTQEGQKNLVVARFPLRDYGGQTLGTCSITTDITEQKAFQSRLASGQKMEAVGRLTGGIAHDFNNLLAVIQGNAELLAEEIGGGRALIQPILHASARGAELIHSLLAFARKQTLRPEAVDLGSLVDRTIDLLSRTLGPGITIQREISATTVCALADPGQVELALLNLALNARDAMAGEGTLTITCKKAPLGSGGQGKAFVLLSVADDGCGMSPEARQHAFEPFYTTKETGKGSGLGLAMVYGFSKQSGGWVTCRSTEGEGTTITLFLPAAAEEGCSRAKPATAPLPHAKGETILLLEDDEDLLHLTGRTLRKLGYKVLTASRVAEARALLSDEKGVDLLLSDLLLPGGEGGIDFAKEARQLRPGISVILMSGNLFDHGDLGSGTPFLRKPFQRRDLAETLRRTLDQRDAAMPGLPL
ncbi:MAG: ATP-binding protein [Kiloniellales bacterium]